MSERGLYDAELLALAAEPSSLPPGPTHSARVHNPYCADEVALHLVVRDGVLDAAGWQGDACAVCRASAALLVRQVGRSLTELTALRGQLDASGPGVASVPSPGPVKRNSLVRGSRRVEEVFQGESGASASAASSRASSPSPACR